MLGLVQAPLSRVGSFHLYFGMLLCVLLVHVLDSSNLVIGISGNKGIADGDGLILRPVLLTFYDRAFERQLVS